MGEVIQFVSKPERERARLVRQARAIYDSIFPPAHRIGEWDRIAMRHAADSTNPHRGDEVLPS
jgi:type II secretory pathway component PulL